MKKFNLGRISCLILCFVVFAGLAGCSSSRGFFAYLKFWETRETPAKEQANQASVFMSQVRPAKGNPESHYRLAIFYQARGRHQEAIEEFAKTLAIDPGYIAAYNGVVISYDNLGKFDKAREAYYTAIQLAPEDYQAYNNLGYSLIMTKDYEESAEVLKKGIDINAGNEHMRNNLAMVYTALDEKKLDVAELQGTKKPANASKESAMVEIQDRLDRIENKTKMAGVSAGISSENIRPTPSTNRFVKKITRSLNAAKKADVKVAAPRTITLKVVRLKPDFIKVSKQNVQKIATDPSKELLQKIFLAQPAEGPAKGINLAKQQQLL
jgi:Flp pilus assembly protein TadD